MTAFSSEDQDAILRFVFGSKDNVHLALGVLRVQQQIKNRIIGEFLDTLKKRLERPGWTVSYRLADKKVDKISDVLFERWWSLSLSKDDWDDLYSVALCPELRGARGFIVGVGSDYDRLGGRSDEGRIMRALEGKVRKGATSNSWPYWTWADPYRDWSDEDTLAGFIRNSGKDAAIEIAKTMETIADAAESVVDDVIRSRR